MSSFSAIHKRVVYALVLVGLIPLLISGQVGPVPTVLTLATIAASWFRKVPSRRDEERATRWNLFTLACLVGLTGLGAVTGDFLQYAILFTLVLICIRFHQSRSARDTYQLYGLSFVSLIAGAVVNPDLSFLLAFVAYVVLLTWGLVLLHVQRDLEELADEDERLGDQPRDRQQEARRMVSGRFLAGTSALALMVFASSLTIFFLFPRLGLGFFLGQNRPAQSVSGFNDKIELGHFGTIKDNMAVVMRVEFPSEPGKTDRTLRMRGITFDNYDGNTWRKTTRETLAMPAYLDGTWRVLHHGGAPTGEELVQEIYLEPLNVRPRVVFGLPQIVELGIDNANIDRLKRDRLRFFQDASADVTVRGRVDSALNYRATSLEGGPGDAALRDAIGAAPSLVTQLYTQLPDDMDPRIEALTRQVIGDARSPALIDRVRAVERHLKSNYGYSRTGGHDPDAPLESFLFDKQPGHCEYFSSAMVVMLRTVGIPARPANGFYGGAWNEYGEYYAVRQADAHSWVEVWFPGFGWQTFDPTSSVEVLVPAADGPLSAFGEWVDSMRLAWFKWVVEYDLEQQLEFFRNLGSTVRGLFPTPEGATDDPGAWKKGIKTWVKNPTLYWTIGGVVFFVILLRMGVFGWLRRRIRRLFGRTAPPPGGVAGRYYAKMLAVLRKRGVMRLPSETPAQLAARLAAGGFDGAAPVQTITAAFERSRYAEDDIVSEPAQARLDDALSALR